MLILPMDAAPVGEGMSVALVAVVKLMPDIAIDKDIIMSGLMTTALRRTSQLQHFTSLEALRLDFLDKLIQPSPKSIGRFANL